MGRRQAKGQARKAAGNTAFPFDHELPPETPMPASEQEGPQSLERRLIQRFLQVRNGVAFDPEDPAMALEAIQVLFDFLIKIDYTLGRMGARLDLSGIAKRFELCGRFLGPLEAPETLDDLVPKVHAAKTRAFELVERLSRRLATGPLWTCEVEPGTRSASFDPDYLDAVVADLSRDFPDAALALMGSFLQRDARPSDVDVRIFLPELDLARYGSGVARMAAYQKRQPFPVTFTLIPLSATGFMAADPARSFQRDLRMVKGSLAFRTWPDQTLDTLALVDVCARMQRVRAMDDAGGTLPMAVWRWFANIPFYAAARLAVFQPDLPATARKYGEADLEALSWVELKSRTNLELTEVLAAYAQVLERLVV